MCGKLMCPHSVQTQRVACRGPVAKNTWGIHGLTCYGCLLELFQTNPERQAAKNKGGVMAWWEEPI
jgi:hypothetical protein